MARSQAQIGLICETLLTASSDVTRSLQGVDTSGLIQGTRAFVVNTNQTFELAPTSTLTPDNDKIVAAYGGGGNWLLVEGGDDPVVVRTLADLPAPVGVVYTLAASTMYLIEGDLTIPNNYYIVGSAGSGLQGGAGAILRGNIAGALIRPTTGTAFRINNLTVHNSGGAAMTWTGDNDGSQLWMHDVSMTGTGAAAVTLTGGGASDYINVYDSRFTGSGADLAIYGTWGSVVIEGCRFLGADNGIDIYSTIGLIGTMLIGGCEFIVGSGDNGIYQDQDDAVTIGRLVGNNFWGAGAAATAISARVATTEWEARGNVNVADF